MALTVSAETGVLVDAVIAMRERLPAQSLIEQVLRMQEVMPPRGRRAALFGRSPLHSSAWAWYAGAVGELKVAGLLARLPASWTVMHSLPVGRKETDIDHLVVGPAGVFTVNTKHHRGKRIWVGGRTLMVSGQRQRYIEKAEAEARQVRVLLSRHCSVSAQVRPVIAILGASVTVRTRPREVTVLDALALPRWFQRQQRVLDDAALRAVVAALDRPEVWRPTTPTAPDAAVRFMALREEVERAATRRVLWVLALVPGLLILAPLLFGALVLIVSAAATRLQ